MKMNKRHDAYGIANKITNAVGDSLLPKLLTKTPLGATIAKQILTPLSAPGYDVDGMLKTEDGKWLLSKYPMMLASDDGPKVHKYWNSLGLKKEVHGRIDKPEGYWSIFLPEEIESHPEKKYPLVFLIHGANNPIRLMQGTGFLEVAAKDKVIVVTPQNADEDYLVDLYHQILRDYPVDVSRVYMTGLSFGGHTTSRMAMTHPELFAAVAPGDMMSLGDQKAMRITAIDYDEFHHTEAMVDHAAEVGLPSFTFVGMSEMLKYFPLYDSDMSYAVDTKENDDNYIRLEFNDDTLYQWFNAYRRMAGCDPVDPKEAEEKSKVSDDYMERFSGMLFESTEVWNLSGRNHYVGNSTNADGETLFQVVAVEDFPHFASSHWGELVWNFLKQFSRDPETGKIVLAD